MELLSVPFAFSQRPLLNPQSFVKEAGKRGIHLFRDQLELLHKRGLLVPLFRVYSRQVEPPELPRPEGYLSGWAGDVHWAKAEGRLRDPSTTRFRPWPNLLSKAEVLYSWYQLLALQQLDSWVGHIKGRRVDDGIEWELPFPNRMAIEMARDTRSLAIILEVLSPRYRPRVVKSMALSFPEDRAEMERHVWSPPSNASSEQGLLSEIGPEVLLRQAEDLLMQARFFDPMGEWHQVVRAGATNRWEDLKFDALQAMDWRVAAEMLLLFYEDLAEQGLAEPLPEPTEMWGPSRQDRLKVDYLGRSEALQRFRLDNAPAVLVGVEGETEEYMLSRGLDWAGYGLDTGLVDIVNLKGIDADVALIARALVTPKLTEMSPHRSRLLRPLTALVVAVDQEGRYGSLRKQQDQRDRIIQQMWESLPEAFQTDTVRKDLQHLVAVETWGEEGCFEFAHFTDTELAQSIHRIATKRQRTIRPPEQIEQALACHRNNKQNIGKAWKNWDWQPSKVELAEETWPILLRNLTEQDHMEIPIGRTLQTIVDLVGPTRRATHMRTNDTT